MAASGGVVSLCKSPVWRDSWHGVRVLCHGCRVTAALQPCRRVHASPPLPAKSYLHKFSGGHKKKVWYDTPLYFPTNNKPPGLMALMKQPKKENKRINIRIQTLNVILYDALTSLLNTAEVSDEVYNLHIELSKVSIPADFSVCRAYWLSSGNKDTDVEIDQILQKYAPRFRHLMISHKIIGKVPPVVFVRDKEDARRQEVEELLTLIRSEIESDSSIKTENISRKPDSESHAEDSTIHPFSMFGIDHAELNQQIVEYKKKRKDKLIVTDDHELGQRQQEQLAEIRKQNLQRKKMKSKWVSRNYMSPQDYLLAIEMNSEKQDKFDSELQEDLLLYDDEEEEEIGGDTPK